MSETPITALCDFFEREFIVPVGSGTAGLKLVLETIGIIGKRVLIPALTCPNVAVSVLAAGGIPVLVDVSENDYCIGVDALNNVMDKTVAAIIAVDAFGYPANIQAIRKIAEPFGSVVIEDACQAYGGRVEGNAVGASGEVGIVSFGHAKPVELAGGGLIITDSPVLFERFIKILSDRSYRRLPKLRNRIAIRLMLRDNYRKMTSWAKRFGLLNYNFPPRLLERLLDEWSQFVKVNDRLSAALADLRPLVTSLPGVEAFDYKVSGWLPWRYSFKAASTDEARQLVARLASVGIRTSRLYRPVDEFLEVETAGNLESSRDLSNRTVNLVYRTKEREISSMLSALERLVGQV